MPGAGCSDTARCMSCRLAASKLPNVTNTTKKNNECRNIDAPRKNKAPVQRAKIALGIEPIVKLPDAGYHTASGWDSEVPIHGAALSDFEQTQ